MDPAPGLSGVPVAGQVDQARQESPVAALADEEANLPVLGQSRDADEGRIQLLDVGLEQLIARMGFDGLPEGATSVILQVVAGTSHQLLGLFSQQRHPLDRLGIGGLGPEPHEPVLPDHPTAVVVDPGGDIVEVRVTVDRGLCRVFRDHQEPALAGRISVEAILRKGMQNAQPGAGNRGEASPGIPKLVVPQEQEVALGHPAQQIDRAPHHLRRNRLRVGIKPLDNVADHGPHRFKIRGRLHHGLKSRSERRLQVMGQVCSRGAQGWEDLEADPRLLDGIRALVNGDKLAIATHRQQARMEDPTDGPALATGQHRDRGHQERTIVGHDLDQRAAASADPLAQIGRGEHPQQDFVRPSLVRHRDVRADERLKLLTGPTRGLVGVRFAVIRLEDAGIRRARHPIGVVSSGIKRAVGLVSLSFTGHGGFLVRHRASGSGMTLAPACAPWL